MAKLNSTDGFILHGWMVTELGLKGGELFTFALINQFSQSNAGIYKGGIPYLCGWLGCSENTARTYLRKLESDGLIMSERGTIGGVPFCHYAVNQDTLQKLRGYPSKIEGYTLQNLRGENNIDNKREYNKERENRATFSKPSIDDVRDYCKSRGNDLDPEEFWAFYESKGWKVGNAPMKDWKAAVITWEKKRKATPRPPEKKNQSLTEYYAELLKNNPWRNGNTPDEQ